MAYPITFGRCPTTLQSSPLPQISTTVFARRLLAGVLLVNLFVAILAASWLSHSRAQDIEDARVTAQNLSKALDQYILGIVKNTDLVLLTVVDEYARQSASGGISAAAAGKFLATLQAHLPELESLRIADAEGNVRHGQGVAPGSLTNISDREYFIAARDGAAPALVISQPLFARISQKWALVFARRLETANGAFAGVVYVNVALEEFSRTFATLDVGARGAITLRGSDLGVIVRHPEPKGIGSTIGNKAVSHEFRDMIQSGQTAGAFTVRAGLDNIERVFAFRRIGTYPLFVIVGLASDDFLVEWRAEVAGLVPLLVLFFLATLLASRVLFNAWKRQAAFAEELQRQERKFHALADFTYDWEYWQGPDRREILYMTPSCERITGYVPADFAADPELLMRIVHPDDRRIMDEHLCRYAERIEETIDFRIVRRDGGIAWIAHACRPIYGASGEFLGRRVGNRDITERKNIAAIELRLRNSLLHLSEIAAFSHLPLQEQFRRALAIGAAHFDLEFGVVSRVEGGQCRIVAQVSPPGTLADDEAFPLAGSCCNIALAEKRLTALTDITTPVCAYGNAGIKVYIGAPIWVGGEIFGTLDFCSAAPDQHTFDDGDKEFVVLLTEWAGSVLERKRTQQKLADSERYLRTIVDTEPECVKVLAADNTLLQMNRAGLDMIEAETAEQVIGRTIIDVIAPPHRAAFIALGQRVQRGESGSLEFEIVGLKGTRRWMETHAVPLRDAEGNISSQLGVTRDITERKLAVEALRRSEARLNEAQRIAQIGSWEIDLRSRAVSWSDETYRIFDIAPGATISYETFLATVHPEDRELLDRSFSESIRNRRPYELTHRLLLGDQSIKYIHGHGETFYDDDGTPLRSIGTVQDVTLQMLSEDALRESEERFRTIADYTYDWEYWQGPQSEFLYISPACKRVTGYSQAEFISDPGLVYSIIHPEDRHLMDGHLNDIRHEDASSLDFRIVTKEGELRWIAHGCRAVFANDGRFMGRRASNRDITDRKNIEAQVERLAYFDTLTGLPNRRMLADRLAQGLSQARRYHRSLAVMFLDLDHFKQINDTLGHDTGDELLKEIAERLNTCVRSGDTVSRQGGDEFVIILAEIAHPGDAARVAEKILAALALPVHLKNRELHITTSIGIAVYPVDGADDAQELMKKADQAMYAAKGAGRNGYRFHAPEPDLTIA